jgi:cytochrome c-type biogenesis protein CcmF
MLAHAGLGVTLLGVTGTTVWRTEALEVLAPGQTMQAGEYTLRFDGVTLVQGPNYQAVRANIEAIKDNHLVGMLAPEKRGYPVEGEVISDTAIRTTGFSDLYVALGDDRGGGRYVIRAYVNPLAPFIWFGGLIMALGGLASLWSRLRFRFARASAKPVAAE